MIGRRTAKPLTNFSVTKCGGWPGQGRQRDGRSALPCIAVSLERWRRLTSIKFLTIKEPADLSNNILFSLFFYEQDERCCPPANGLGLGSPLQFLPQLSWLCSPHPPAEVWVIKRWHLLPFFFFFFFTQRSRKRNTSAIILLLHWGKMKKSMLLPDELMKIEVTSKAPPWNVRGGFRNILLPRSCHWVEAGREVAKGEITSEADLKLLFPLFHSRGDGWVASKHSLPSPVCVVPTLVSCSLCYVNWNKKKPQICEALYTFFKVKDKVKVSEETIFVRDSIL